MCLSLPQVTVEIVKPLFIWMTRCTGSPQPPFPDPSQIQDRIIDTRSYQGSLSFYDEGKDASDEMLDGLYYVDWEAMYDGDMERLYHIEKIQGVHTRIVQVRNDVGTGKVIAFTNPPIIIVIDDISELS